MAVRQSRREGDDEIWGFLLPQPKHLGKRMRDVPTYHLLLVGWQVVRSVGGKEEGGRLMGCEWVPPHLGS